MLQLGIICTLPVLFRRWNLKQNTRVLEPGHDMSLWLNGSLSLRPRWPAPRVFSLARCGKNSRLSQRRSSRGGRLDSTRRDSFEARSSNLSGEQGRGHAHFLPGSNPKISSKPSFLTFCCCSLLCLRAFAPLFLIQSQRCGTQFQFG